MALAIPANRSPSSPLAGSSNSPRSTRDRFGAPSARPVAVKGADHVGAQPTSQAGHQLDCNLHHGEHWQLQQVGHKLRQPGARRRIALLTDLHSTAHFANHDSIHGSAVPPNGMEDLSMKPQWPRLVGPLSVSVPNPGRAQQCPGMPAGVALDNRVLELTRLTLQRSF